MSDDTIFDEIDAGILAALQADDWFNPAVEKYVPSIAEETGDIEREIQIKVKRIGIVAVVRMVQARCENPNVRGPYFDPVRHVVEVAENVTINRGAAGTQRKCKAVAARVARLLHQHTIAGMGACLLVDDEGIRLADNPPGATCTYHVNMVTSGGIKLT